MAATEKTEFLFENRLMPLFFDMLGVTGTRGVERRLRKIQRAIYNLDAFGETTWHIMKVELADRWDEIYAAFHDAGFDLSAAQLLSRDVAKYQQIELATRSYKTPLRLPIYSHYWLKTCDVRMQRLITCILGNVPCLGPIKAAWNVYDVLSEMYDDLEDIVEDSRSYNCNRFVVACRTHGTCRAISDLVLAAHGLCETLPVRLGLPPEMMQLIEYQFDELRRASLRIEAHDPMALRAG